MLQSILVCLWQLLINTNGCQHRDNSSSAFKLWDNLITQAAGEPTLKPVYTCDCVLFVNWDGL